MNHIETIQMICFANDFKQGFSERYFWTNCNSNTIWDAYPLQQPPCKKQIHYRWVTNQQNRAIMKVEKSSIYLIFAWTLSYSFSILLWTSSTSSSLRSHLPSSTSLNIFLHFSLSSIISKKPRFDLSFQNWFVSFPNKNDSKNDPECCLPR